MNFYELKSLNITGGGAFRFEKYIRERLCITINKLDEMKMLVQGLNFVLDHVENEVFTYFHEKRKAQFVVPRYKQKGRLARDDDDDDDDDDRYPYLLVNIGSGVSILKVIDHSNFHRVSGSSIGGGTFWGLLRQLTDVTSWDEVQYMSNIGQNKNLDLLVGDIYGTNYELFGLGSSVIASSFGKVGTRYDFGNPYFSPLPEFHSTTVSLVKEGGLVSEGGLDEANKAKFLSASGKVYNLKNSKRVNSATSRDYIIPNSRRGSLHRRASESDTCKKSSSISISSGYNKQYSAADIVQALLFMICNNIGQVSYLNANLHRVKRVYFAGGFIQGNPYIWSTLSNAIRFWSKGEMEAMFLVHDGYLGALGSLIQRKE